MWGLVPRTNHIDRQRHPALARWKRLVPRRRTVAMVALSFNVVQNKEKEMIAYAIFALCVVVGMFKVYTFETKAVL